MNERESNFRQADVNTLNGVEGMAAADARVDTPDQGAAARAPGGEVPLPCLNSNNSTGQCQSHARAIAKLLSYAQRNKLSFEDADAILHTGEDLEKVVDGLTVEAEKRVSARRKTKQGRAVIEIEGEKLAVGKLSTAEKKTAFCLRENVKSLANRYGLNRLGFLTLTFADQVTDVKEAQRRFNSATTHLLRELFADWIVVVEPQTHRNNVVHYHLLVVCKQDIRTGFDFAGVACGDYRSANPYLRGTWARLRGNLSRYGFGRSELMPIKSTREGIAKYVGKYLAKGTGERLGGWESARMVRYSTRTNWRTAFCNFAWTSNGAKIWRQLLRDVAAIVGAESPEDMADLYGPRWAWPILQAVADARKRGLVASPEAVAALLEHHRLMQRIAGRCGGVELLLANA